MDGTSSGVYSKYHVPGWAVHLSPIGPHSLQYLHCPQLEEEKREGGGHTFTREDGENKG